MNKDLFNQDIKVIHNCVDSLMKSLSELNTVYKSMEQDPNLNGRKDVAKIYQHITKHIYIYIYI